MEEKIDKEVDVQGLASDKDSKVLVIEISNDYVGRYSEESKELEICLVLDKIETMGIVCDIEEEQIDEAIGMFFILNAICPIIRVDFDNLAKEVDKILHFKSKYECLKGLIPNLTKEEIIYKFILWISDKIRCHYYLKYYEEPFFTIEDIEPILEMDGSLLIDDFVYGLNFDEYLFPDFSFVYKCMMIWDNDKKAAYLRPCTEHDFYEKARVWLNNSKS